MIKILRLFSKKKRDGLLAFWSAKCILQNKETPDSAWKLHKMEDFHPSFLITPTFYAGRKDNVVTWDGAKAKKVLESSKQRVKLIRKVSCYSPCPAVTFSLSAKSIAPPLLNSILKLALPSQPPARWIMNKKALSRMDINLGFLLLWTYFPMVKIGTQIQKF